VILVAPDLKEELPVLYLRLREAALDDGLPIIELAPQRSGLSRYAASTLLYRPGDVALLAHALVANTDPTGDVAGVPPSSVTKARNVLAKAREKDGPDADVVVVLGRPSLAEAATWVVEAASILNSIPNVRFLSALRRSNVRGALDMGLAPGILPGRVSLADGRGWYEDAWQTALPAAPGLDATGMLTEASEGRLAGMILLGADPLSDFPDRTLAKRGLDGAGFVVAVDCYLTESSRRADVILPAATYGERAGTFTNLEGRVMRLGEKITPPGVAWPDWMIASELAFRLGGDLGFDNLESVWDEIERTGPAYAGMTGDLLADRAAKDGLVAPLSEEAQPVPAPIDPMSDPGIGSVETQGVPVVSMSSHESASGVVSDRPVPRPEPSAPRPPLLRFARPGPGALAPRRDGYSLRLVTGRTLWDNGTLVQHAPHLAHLAPPDRLRVHPADLAPLGTQDGGRVRVTSARGSAVLDVHPDSALPRGTAVLTFNLAGDGASTLIDATAEATDVRLEAV
jgi:NADH-quinone oxidoreductase subunit G